MSKIYLVQRIESDADHLSYDEYHGHIVVATSPEEAQKLCAENPGDEGADVWLTNVSIEEVGYPLDGTPRIILSDFNAG